MNIGPEKRTITVEPIQDPFPPTPPAEPVPAPAPERTPEAVPVESSAG